MEKEEKRKKGNKKCVCVCSIDPSSLFPLSDDRANFSPFLIVRNCEQGLLSSLTEQLTINESQNLPVDVCEIQKIVYQQILSL